MRAVATLLFLIPALACAVEVNSATRAQLERLDGLGVATVERILRAREAKPFADWRDLAARVPGLRGKRATRLERQGLTVNGQSLPAGSAGRR